MSVFTDDWRQCLREQYKHVIRTNDEVTRPSLTRVLYSVGFTDDELRQLAVEATMHVDDVPEGFVPDLDVLVPPPATEPAFQPHPLECQCPQCVDTNLIPHDEDGQPIEFDPDDPENPANQVAQDDDEDSPQQMSMF
jgi:hypothetical protein